MNRKTRTVTIYRDDSTTQVIYDTVKHIFWTASNTVLVLAVYSEPESDAHHYIHWPRERFCWFKDVPNKAQAGQRRQASAGKVKYQRGSPPF